MPAPTASPRRRRALRAASTVLIVAGALVLADAVLTLLWQEPVTALQTRLRQDGLRDDLRRLQRAGPTRLEARALAGLAGDRRRIAFLARSLRRRTAEGDAVGRIRIPRIGADFVVVKGSSAAALRKGPGTYDQTALPGVPGTTAIAGHRTTYLAPFRHIDRLRAGDAITIEMPYATFTYNVERTRIVDPDALWILGRARTDTLVLSACHPLFSAAKRIVVFARLARVIPQPIVRGGQGSDRLPAPLTPTPA
ncbi:class E sortase [Baekduia soli]|uniref:Class E sortase n=1 Tax=Baekduia soli TaxID=496014 RepID=A0A5B8U1A9_9ACTN|nr:sortase [Baekduia soli]QEC46722.1 class E sortase [Baekduia soli]